MEADEETCSSLHMPDMCQKTDVPPLGQHVSVPVACLVVTNNV
jgi:hypothetical protein